MFLAKILPRITDRLKRVYFILFFFLYIEQVLPERVPLMLRSRKGERKQGSTGNGQRITHITGSAAIKGLKKSLRYIKKKNRFSCRKHLTGNFCVIVQRGCA